jgi:ribosomal protein L27
MDEFWRTIYCNVRMLSLKQNALQNISAGVIVIKQRI